MRKFKRELYYKKIGELTQKEFEQLFNVATDITEPSFRKKLEPIADQTIAGINVSDYDLNSMDFVTAYLLGNMSALKAQIPENCLVVLFGEPGCGKSHLINLVLELKKRDLTQITEEDREFFGVDPNDHTSDGEIRELKDMVDSISIIQKKSTRPPRTGNPNKPEIREGMERGEVAKCEWTYEFAGNLYGVLKEEVDAALEKGNAMLIVNDASMQVMRGLQEAYPKNYMPTIVYKDIDRKKWVEDMKKAGRTDKEIEARMATVGNSQKIYDKSCLPGVIFNMENGRTTKNLLGQLNGVISLKEKMNEYGLERE